MLINPTEEMKNIQIKNESIMKRQKVFLYEISTCTRRKLDIQRIHQYFFENNYTIVTNPKEADIIILSTCAYSIEHAKTSLEMTKKLSKYDAELVVSGCLPDIEKDKLSKIFNGKTLGTKNLNRIDDYFPNSQKKFSNIEDSNFPWENVNEYRLIKNFKQKFKNSRIPDNLIRIFENYSTNLFFKDTSVDRPRNLVKYSYFKHITERVNPKFSIHKNSFFIRPCGGCLGNCSYCVIKKSIGPLQSKPLDVLIQEFSKGLNTGYKNFILDADDLGAFGQDINSNFVEMLDILTEIPGDYTLHLRYIHPRWIVRYINQFIDVLKKGKIHSVSSAIQSASPRILKLMNRYSKIDQIKNAYKALVEANPNLKLTTECINGFPTETKEEFKTTLEFINDINFQWGFIFPFSVRPGTKAEKIEPKVSEDEIMGRMKYAKKYLKKIGYNSSSFKPKNILAFVKDSPTLDLDEGAKSFCFSTVE